MSETIRLQTPVYSHWNGMGMYSDVFLGYIQIHEGYVIDWRNPVVSKYAFTIDVTVALPDRISYTRTYCL